MTPVKKSGQPCRGGVPEEGLTGDVLSGGAWLVFQIDLQVLRGSLGTSDETYKYKAVPVGPEQKRKYSGSPPPACTRLRCHEGGFVPSRRLHPPASSFLTPHDALVIPHRRLHEHRSRSTSNLGTGVRRRASGGEEKTCADHSRLPVPGRVSQHTREQRCRIMARCSSNKRLGVMMHCIAALLAKYCA